MERAGDRQKGGEDKRERQMEGRLERGREREEEGEREGGNGRDRERVCVMERVIMVMTFIFSARTQVLFQIYVSGY